MPSAEWLPVVLAAGLSRRMGAPKLALAHDGVSVLAASVDAVRRATGQAPLVVAPAAGPVFALASHLGVVAALNPAPERGLSASLAIAARAAGRRGLLVFLGDEPEVSGAAVAAVAATVARWPEAQLVVPRFRGDVPGHPVYAARSLLAGVDRLRGDRGARALAVGLPPNRVHAVAVDEVPPGDLDTPEDWERFQQQRLGAERDPSEPEPS
ncbi:MAG: NTP transferase domain-containing protein [Thermaerobacter sp.]|nr:NTP transferase domain-containing protein [Thermaerobacter sp.]